MSNHLKDHVKMDHRIIHALPFVPSRKRQKGFEITRKWGNSELTVSAPETLNYYDLITLLLMVRQYESNNFVYEGEVDGKKLLKMTFDIEQLTKERVILNKKTNRNTLIKSFERLKKVDLKFKEDGYINSTWFIYNLKSDEKHCKNVEILANERFIKACMDGFMVNWKRLALYKDNGCAVILDTYLQGTRKKMENNFIYKSSYDEKTLFELLFPNSDLPDSEKRRIIKKSFVLMHDIGKLPQYTYDKINKNWDRNIQLNRKTI